MSLATFYVYVYAVRDFDRESTLVSSPEVSDSDSRSKVYAKRLETIRQYGREVRATSYANAVRRYMSTLTVDKKDAVILLVLRWPSGRNYGPKVFAVARVVDATIQEVDPQTGLAIPGSSSSW